METTQISRNQSTTDKTTLQYIIEGQGLSCRAYGEVGYTCLAAELGEVESELFIEELTMLIGTMFEAESRLARLQMSRMKIEGSTVIFPGTRFVE